MLFDGFPFRLLNKHNAIPRNRIKKLGNGGEAICSIKQAPKH